MFMCIEGGFLSHRGTPSYHPFLDGIFHDINHPAIKGYPHLWKPSCIYIYTIGSMYGRLMLTLGLY